MALSQGPFSILSIAAPGGSNPVSLKPKPSATHNYQSILSTKMFKISIAIKIITISSSLLLCEC